MKKKPFSGFLSWIDEQTIKKFKKIVRGKNVKFCTIFCHHNADPDAIYASYLTFKLVKHLNPKIECEIIADQGISKISKVLMLKVPVNFKDKPNLEKTDLIILVDTSTFKQLDVWGESLEKLGKPLIVLDHHEVHPKTKEIAHLMVVNPKASSACEIVYDICRNVKVKLDKNDAWSLLAGIVYETKGFRYASSKTLRVSAELLDYGVSLDEIFNLMIQPVDRSEKIAKLKALQRLQIFEVKEWIIGCTHVSSYQASVARTLISLGCDVAIVGGEKKGEVRVSLRSTKNFQEKTSVHLGRDVAFYVGEKFSGMGGGHSTSAGLNVSGNLQDVLSEIVKVLKLKIEEKGANLDE